MAYVPIVDKFGRVLARCPQCHELWKTDEMWKEMRKRAALDILHVLDTMVNAKPSDTKLADYVEGYNRALKDAKEQLSLKAKGLK